MQVSPHFSVPIAWPCAGKKRHIAEPGKLPADTGTLKHPDRSGYQFGILNRMCGRPTAANAKEAVQRPRAARAESHNASSKARRLVRLAPPCSFLSVNTPLISFQSFNTPLTWTDCQETVHGQSGWRSSRAR